MLEVRLSNQVAVPAHLADLPGEALEAVEARAKRRYWREKPIQGLSVT